GGLVEKDHVRFVQQGLGNAETLLHALEEAADLVVHAVGDADEIKHLVDALLADMPGNAEQLAVEIEQAVAGVVVGKAMVLRKVSDAGADVGSPRGLAQEGCRSLSAAADAEQGSNQRGL